MKIIAALSLLATASAFAPATQQQVRMNKVPVSCRTGPYLWKVFMMRSASMRKLWMMRNAIVSCCTND